MSHLDYHHTYRHLIRVSYNHVLHQLLLTVSSVMTVLIRHMLLLRLLCSWLLAMLCLGCASDRAVAEFWRWLAHATSSCVAKTNIKCVTNLHVFHRQIAWHVHNALQLHHLSACIMSAVDIHTRHASWRPGIFRANSPTVFQPHLSGLRQGLLPVVTVTLGDPPPLRV